MTKELYYSLDMKGDFTSIYFDVQTMDAIDVELIEELKETLEEVIDGNMVNNYILTYMDFGEEEDFLYLVEHVEDILDVKLQAGGVTPYIPEFKIVVEEDSSFKYYTVQDTSDDCDLLGPDYFVDSFLSSSEFPKLAEVEFDLGEKDLATLKKDIQTAFGKAAIVR